MNFWVGSFQEGACSGMLGKGRRMCRTYGARAFWALFPALTGWANFCRAYGAGFGGIGKNGHTRPQDRNSHVNVWRRDPGRAAPRKANSEARCRAEDPSAGLRTSGGATLKPETKTAKSKEPARVRSCEERRRRQDAALKTRRLGSGRAAALHFNHTPEVRREADVCGSAMSASQYRTGAREWEK